MDANVFKIFTMIMRQKNCHYWQKQLQQQNKTKSEKHNLTTEEAEKG